MVSIKKVCRSSLDYVLYEHSKKLTPCLFQSYAALYFEPYWKRENTTDLIFGALLS